MLLEWLALTQENIIDFKDKKKKGIFKKITKKLKFKVNTKFIFYFIIRLYLYYAFGII